MQGPSIATDVNGNIFISGVQTLYGSNFGEADGDIISAKFIPLTEEGCSFYIIRSKEGKVIPICL